MKRLVVASRLRAGLHGALLCFLSSGSLCFVWLVLRLVDPSPVRSVFVRFTKSYLRASISHAGSLWLQLQACCASHTRRHQKTSRLHPELSVSSLRFLLVIHARCAYADEQVSVHLTSCCSRRCSAAAFRCGQSPRSNPYLRQTFHVRRSQMMTLFSSDVHGKATNDAFQFSSLLIILDVAKKFCLW